MIDISALCMECLSEKKPNGTCPHCGTKTDFTQESPLLPLKSIIAQRYVIAKMRKQNSEGITYSAFDLKLNKPVSVREFFPANIARRQADLISVAVAPENNSVYTQYLNAFVLMWIKLQRLKGLSALISVNEVFQDNGTAYAVYDDSERITLRDYLLDTPEGFITWEKARLMFMPVLSTIGTLHTSGIVHKGINPSAFIFSKDGKLKLTDFCIEAVRTTTGALDSEIFDGYAAYEQYTINKQLGPYTDIYSFCSVLYRALIGTTPIDAKTRARNDQMMIPAKFAEQLPPYVINALINGMAIEPDDRTDNIEQLRNDLSASPRVIGASAPAYTPPVTIEKKPAPPVQKSAPQRPSSQRPAPQQPVRKPAPSQEDRIKARRIAEQEEKNKKKNILIGVLFAILAVLIIGIGILTAALFNTNEENNDPSSSDVPTAIGEELVQVPNFVNGRITDIIANPVYTDYFDIKTVEENSATVAKGYVIAQSIPANATANIGDTITLTVSSGPKAATMDDVTGWSYIEAEKHLTAQGYVCSKSYYHNDGTHTPDTVFETTPAAGELVAEGASVIIIVYSEIADNNTPAQNSGEGNAVEEFLNDLESTEPQF